MKILFATPESAPFIKTGGLGDVSQAYPAAMSKNAEIRVILPLYGDIAASYKNSLIFVGSSYVTLGWRRQYAGLFSCELGKVTYYFIDNEYYFKRKGLYGYFDDGERFAFFSRAVLELLPLTGFYPDVLHLNDWQTASAALMLDCFYRHREEYGRIKTVLTIHNIEFQGIMEKAGLTDVLGLPEASFGIAEFRGNANLLKAGIESADRIVTVSPTYAEEILDPYFAYGLSEILNARKFKLSGIVNGIDAGLYDPAADKALFENYTIKNYLSKKRLNKEGLLGILGLPCDGKLLIGMVTRLTAQKGIDLVVKAIDDLLALDVRMVILGTGDWKYENALQEAQKRYPSKLAVVVNFSSDLASKIYGGADLFLMPSRFEPCGLSQMIAMRYGTVPIVRETGGLKDTVPAFNPVEKTGAGFTFKTFDVSDMLDAVGRAIASFGNKEERAAVIKNAMKTDVSWDKSAGEYLKLYQNLI